MSPAPWNTRHESVEVQSTFQIHKAAGSELLEECAALGGCQTGQAKITKGYNLPAAYVIHTVGPRYGREQGLDEKLLRNCYLNSLKVAKENNIKSLSFPAISTGAYGYPIEKAAQTAVSAIKNYIQANPDDFEKIVFVLFSDEDLIVYKNLLV